MSNIKRKYFSIYSVLIFLMLLLPAYYLLENSEMDWVRAAYYPIPFALAVSLIISSLSEKQVEVKRFGLTLALLACYAVPIFVNLSLAFPILPMSTLIIDIVVFSYCIMAFSMGLHSVDILYSRKISKLLFASWFLITSAIFLKSDFQSLRVPYGRFNEDFSGVYQYLGDMLGFLSILISLKFSLGNTKETFDKSSGKPSLLLFVVVVILSSAALFLNGSRASLVAFLMVVPYLIYIFISAMSKKSKLGVLIVFAITFLLIAFLRIIAPDFLENVFSLDISSSRNAELLSGNSGSADTRIDVLQKGLENISDSFLLGTYIERSLNFGRGSYIHNIIAVLQDFGILPFLSYLVLIALSFKEAKYEKILSLRYPSLLPIHFSVLVFNCIQVVLFRYAPGYLFMFFSFGMSLNIMRIKEISPVYNVDDELDSSVRKYS
jgi:hypothetical protein